MEAKQYELGLVVKSVYLGGAGVLYGSIIGRDGDFFVVKTDRGNYSIAPKDLSVMPKGNNIASDLVFPTPTEEGSNQEDIFLDTNVKSKDDGGLKSKDVIEQESYVIPNNGTTIKLLKQSGWDGKSPILVMKATENFMQLVGIAHNWNYADFNLFEGATIGKTLYVNIDAIPKEDRDKFIKAWLDATPHNYILSESHLPITQEFIESFGFNEIDEKFPAKRYYKKTDRETVLLTTNSNFYSLFEHGLERDLAIFVNYTCTTQSELRFLLTKGRIDCSK